MKKILFVITYPELGGAQKQLFSLIKGLDRGGYSTHLFTGDQGCLRGAFTGLPYLNTKVEPMLVRHINPLCDLIAFFKLYSYIRKHNFDIVHTHSPKASLLGRWAAHLAGVKNIVCTVHGWPFHAFMNPVSFRFYLFLERLTAKVTKRIIVVSKRDLKTGIEKMVAPPAKFNLIHYGIDIGSFEEVYSKRREAPPDRNFIVNISSLKRQKGLGHFLRSAKLISNRNKEVKFSLIGGGPLKKKIRRDIAALGLKDSVSLDGWTKDVPSILSRASVLMLTSLWEGLPVAIMEAIAAGVPVVTTDTGGLLDIMRKGKDGIVIEPKDEWDASAAVSMILDNPKEWSERIENNRGGLNLPYWSEERMIKETARLYESL